MKTRHRCPLRKFCISFGNTVDGIGGSMLTDALDLDTLSRGGFALSGVGSIVGVYVGWKLARKLEE